MDVNLNIGYVPGSVIVSTGSANGTIEQSAGNGIVIRANSVYLSARFKSFELDG